MFAKPALAAAAALALGMGVSACSMDPGAPLIPLPEQRATVLPSQAAPVSADGFANILADPATVAGLPRTPGEVDAAEASVASAGAVAAARGDSIAGRPSQAGALARRGRSHVADAEARIMAGAREVDPSAPVPVSGALTGGSATSSAPARAPLPPGQPLDPDAPLPRNVYN